MRRLTIECITQLTDAQCLSMLSEVDREIAKRLGNSARDVLMTRAKGRGVSQRSSIAAFGDGEKAQGPNADPTAPSNEGGHLTRAQFDELSRTYGNPPAETAARFIAKGGRFAGEDGSEESDDGDDDDDDDDLPPVAAGGSEEEPFVTSDDGTREHARRILSAGGRIHHGQAAPLWPREYVPASVDDPAPVVSRARRT